MRSCNWTASLPRCNSGAEAIAAGDISAISPYLKALDRLDRYQGVASENQAYDDEARRKLLEKINRLAANLGIDEAFVAAVKERLKKTRQAAADEPGGVEGEGSDHPSSSELPGEPNALETPCTEVETRSGFLSLYRA
jgi:hypothetical protein